MQMSPIAKHNLFRSQDLAETRERVGEFLWPHRMQLCAAKDRVDTRLDGVFLDDIALIYLHYGAPVLVDPGQISDYYLIQTVLSGNGHVSNGRREMDTGVGLTTVISPSEATRIRMSDDCGHLILRVRRDVLERYLREQLDRELAVPLVFELALHHNTPAGAAWYQTLLFLCRQYSTGDACLRSAAMQRQFTELAVSQLLHTHQHNNSVTDVLVALGINNLGRFADYYRRRYGCLPSETLRR